MSRTSDSWDDSESDFNTANEYHNNNDSNLVNPEDVSIEDSYDHLIDYGVCSSQPMNMEVEMRSDKENNFMTPIPDHVIVKGNGIINNDTYRPNEGLQKVELRRDRYDI